MEWLETLRDVVVGLDTAPLIYFIEVHPVYLGVVRPFFEAVERGEIKVVTSTLTLAEVLVHPLKQGDTSLANKYRDILENAANLQVLPMTAEVATRVARIRADHNIRTPDAIQLATAQYAGATSFLTNDTQLPSLPGLRMLVLDALRSDTQASPE